MFENALRQLLLMSEHKPCLDQLIVNLPELSF